MPAFLRRVFGHGHAPALLILSGLLAGGIIAGRVDAEDPTTQPASPSDLDFLLNKSHSLPAQGDASPAPTTDPASPLSNGTSSDDTRHGTITLSDGTTLAGDISHTQRKPIRVFVNAESQFVDVWYTSIAKIEAVVLWEKLEREWNFKQSGSDVKVYTGRSYPARQTDYRITLKSGKTITGSVVEPLYLKTPDGHSLYVLHKRDKGEMGQALGQLIYVKQVEFGDTPTPAATQPAVP